MDAFPVLYPRSHRHCSLRTYDENRCLGGKTLPQIPTENATTIENLLAAFEGESNANAKYVAFAVKADADGWHGAASLFRAAAQAEQIHAANHARVIRQLGGEACCEIHAVPVKATLENLKAALAGEQLEIESMYPEFVKEAELHRNTAAIRTFTWALEAEKTHAKLYAEAVTLVEAGDTNAWVGAPRDFYVCAACGYTSALPHEHERCPVCNLSSDKFEVFR
jgi:rubrerythrin